MRKMDQVARTNEPFDMYFWFELLTMDLMGELALGNNFGLLEAGRPARYSTLVEQLQRFNNPSGMLHLERTMSKSSAGSPFHMSRGSGKLE